jgi:hypothetical protein
VKEKNTVNGKEWRKKSEKEYKKKEGERERAIEKK